MINNHDKSNFRRLVVTGECSGENRRTMSTDNSLNKSKQGDRTMTEGEVETEECSSVCGLQVYALLYVGL